MRGVAAAALTAVTVVTAACPGPGADTVRVTPGSGSAIAATPDAAPPDAPEATQEERLAAIQKAMNELDEAAQACWAAAAVERFDIEGELVATIDIQRAGAAQVSLARDTTRNGKLAGCVTALLAAYPWAPPLYGQAIQLPFRFRAPEGQNVLDRALVPWHGQGKVAVAVLADEANTGNEHVSLVELAIQAGGSTGARIAERAELWYFLHPATVEVTGAANRTQVAAGDMMYVPRGAARNVIASAGDVHAAIAFVPGGREGAARAGALPTRELGAIKAPVAGPVHLPASAAQTYCLGGAKPPCTRGQVRIFAEPATIQGKTLAASVLEMPAGTQVPEHVHVGETELLYVLAGSGTMTVGGVAIAVTPTSIIQVPPNTKHAFTATADVRSVQLYTPAGPEQRFKAKP